MKKFTSYIAPTAFILAAAPILAFAWTSAPSTPPSNNVDLPINAGGTYQEKIGNVTLNTGNSSTALIIYGSNSSHGKVGIGDIVNPTYKLQVGNSGDGSSIGSNAFFYMSDARLKNDIVTLPDALAKVLQLRGVGYTWKSTGASDVGLIAQEVEKVYPQVVNTGSDGIKAVDYGHLIGPLVEAVKAQQAEIDALKAEVAALKK